MSEGVVSGMEVQYGTINLLSTHVQLSFINSNQVQKKQRSLLLLRGEILTTPAWLATQVWGKELEGDEPSQRGLRYGQPHHQSGQ